MSDPEFEARVLALLDGELPPEEAADLEADLFASEEARETYEELVLLHNALESRFEVKQAVHQMGVVPMERIVTDQHRRVVRLSLVAAAAVLMISAVVMWVILTPQRPQAVGVLRASEGSLYALTFDGEGEAPGSGQIVKGSVIRLERGVLEGVFENGVRLVAEAPCTLRVLSEKVVSQADGRAWFEVPPAATGFTVRTPELVVVDLGTEFGVVSLPDGRDEVHVLKGSVEVTARLGQVSKETLVEGSARRVNAEGRFLEIEPEGKRFQKTIAGPRVIEVANHSFEDDVLARDGDPATKETGKDDYDKEFLPSGWRGFNDGDGGTGGTRGILSTAPDSHFHQSLAATPDPDLNDQVFYSAARDIFQVLPETLEPNSTYVLSVDIGDRAAEGELGTPGNPGIRLGFGDIPGEGLLDPAETRFPEQRDGEWVTWSATFKTGSSPDGAGQPLRIELTSGSRVGWFDCVRLTVSR